jgi:hypothetical protein
MQSGHEVLAAPIGVLEQRVIAGARDWIAHVAGITSRDDRSAI